MKKTDTKNKNNKRVNRSSVSVSSKNRNTANRNNNISGANNSRYGRYSAYGTGSTYGRNDMNYGIYSGSRSTLSGTYSYSRSVNTARRNALHEREEAYMQQMSTPMYNAGSEAYESAYQSEWIPNDNNTSNKKTLKKKSNVRRVREVAPLNLYKTIFTVLVCTFYVLSIVVCIASNNSYKSQLVDAKNTLTQLESDNAELKNEIDDNIDLAKVEKEARKLGMQKPSAFQTVKINVPKESYTVQYGAEEVDEDGIGFAEVMENLTESIQKRLDKILRID